MDDDSGDTASPPAGGALPVGGARTGPHAPDQNWVFQRHVAIYRHLAARITGTVVDAGCGEGYGLRVLRDAGARGVIGVDGDEATVLHARARYANEHIEVVEADLTDLPLVVDTMDAVVAVHVIDRVADLGDVLGEVVRITRAGGTIALATPNRRTALPPGVDAPTNPFHVRAFTAATLAATMEAAGIDDIRVEGVRHGDGLRARLEPILGGRALSTLADPTSWDDELRRCVHAIDPEDFEFTRDDVDASIDLIGWGRV